MNSTSDTSPRLTLDQARSVASPRLSPRATPLLSTLIYVAVVTLWVLLFARAFAFDNIFAWSAGIVYVCYDTFLLAFVAWQVRGIGKAAENDPPQALPVSPSDPERVSPPSLGVIIAARNEAAVLPATIAALLAQSDPPDQILIADDGSNDATPHVLAQYGLVAPLLGEVVRSTSPHLPLNWLRLPHAGKAHALNSAIAVLQTDIILTVDADTLLAPEAIGAMRQAFVTHPNLVAATGLLTPVCTRSAVGRFFQWFQTYEYIRNYVSRFAWMQAESLLLISGAFAGFRRDALIKVGGFDPECLVEDYELIHRLHRHSVDHGLDWQVKVLGQAQAQTDAPSTFPTFLRQRRRWFAGFLQTQYWNRDMTGNGRYGRLGTLMLPIKAIDTMQPIYGLVAFGLLVCFLFGGSYNLALPTLAIVGTKIGIDLSFHIWSLHLYKRWSGDRTRLHIGYALVAALIEPFSFQPLRHTGAFLGWIWFLGRRKTWGRQSRSGLLSSIQADNPST
jgi:cellulose synthase/poly-beta-1,6-N-acetylglucosamine synthase-like glycosyltransferase